jgi:hypothetical protein
MGADWGIRGAWVSVPRRPAQNLRKKPLKVMYGISMRNQIKAFNYLLLVGFLKD